MTSEVKPMKITNHEKLKYKRNCWELLRIFLGIKGTWNIISGNRGTREKCQFFLGYKGTCTPLGGPHKLRKESLSTKGATLKSRGGEEAYKKVCVDIFSKVTVLVPFSTSVTTTIVFGCRFFN